MFISHKISYTDLKSVWFRSLPGPDLPRLELSCGDGDEVRLDGDLLQEAVQPLRPALHGLGVALGHGAHQHSQVGGGGDLWKWLVKLALCQRHL